MSKLYLQELAPLELTINYGSNTYELFISSENGDISKYVFGPDGGKLEGTALSHSGVYEQEARIGSEFK